MKPGRLGIRIGVGLQVISMLVVWAAVNYLGFVHYLREDFSRSKKFRLADQTKAALKEFKQPLEIIVVASPTFLSAESAILPDLRALLVEIVFHKRKELRVEYVDPTRNLTRVRDLQARYNLPSVDNVVIIAHDDTHRLVEIAEMGDFDFSPLATGGQPLLLAFRGEQVLTSALMEMLDPTDRTVYFLTGHGEPLPDGQLSTFAEYIRQQNTDVATLSLASTDSLPEDASVLVITAPQADLAEREVSVLAAWLRDGGRMLVLLDPAAKTPRLHAMLAANGVVPRDDRVLRLIELPFATGILRDVTGRTLPNSGITRRLEGLNILFPGATQSLGFDTALAASERIQLRPLVLAAEEFWGETDYTPNQTDGVRYEDALDNGQPVYIAASADRDAVEDDRVDVATSRLIVAGSSLFVFDETISPQGLDLAIGFINALTDRGNLAGITPKTINRFALRLTDEQLSQLALAVMVVIPACAAFAGLLVWIRRRR